MTFDEINQIMQNQWADYYKNGNSAYSFGLFGDTGLISNPAKAWDTFKNGRTNEVNQQIAQENLKYQYENLEYQKALQEEIFNREDTAYQRTVEDMRNAGLNPLTMNGTNGAGEGIATQPLHNDMQYQDSGMLTALSQIFNIANSFQNFQIGMSKNKEAQAQANIAESNAYIANATAEDKIADSNMNFYQKQMTIEDLWRNTLFNREFNIFNGMEEKTKYLQMLKEYIGQGEHNWIEYDKKDGLSFFNDKGLYKNYNKQSAKGDIEQSIANFSAEMINKIIGAVDLGKEKGSKLLQKIFGL